MGKGFSDVVDFKQLSIPGKLKETKDMIKNIKKSPVEGFTQGVNLLSGIPMGKGARPAAVNQFILSKGKTQYDPNRELDSSFTPNYEPDPVPELPTPTAEAPIAQRGRSVQESARQAKIEAAKRKGLLSTILAANKDSGNKLGGGTSILG